MSSVNNDYSNLINQYMDMDIGNLSTEELALLQNNVEDMIGEILKDSPDTDLAAIASKFGLTMPTGGQEEILKFTVALTLGSTILAEIVENAAEQKAMNREAAFLEGQLAVQLMEKQADLMRTAATIQLVTGIISGAIQMGYSASAAGQAASNPALSQATSGYGSGMSKIVESIGNFAASMIQAEIKDTEAAAESARNMKESIKSLVQAYQELITKALTMMDNMQQNTNQTRTKISG